MLTAQARAVRLLRGHLSPEQRAQLDTVREAPTSGLIHPSLAPHFRWFNVTGSLGGKYTISGVINAGIDDRCYGAVVALGVDRPATDWCVHVYAPRSAINRRHEWMPTADQMLAYKITLETEEEIFLHRACAVTDQAARLRMRHIEAIGRAMERGAV